MSALYDILGVGTAFVDDILHVARYPQADDKQEVTSEKRAFGGCVAAALAAAAKLGGRCAYLGVLGTDDLSESMVRAFDEVGISTKLVLRRDPARPGHSVIIADDTAHTRAIFYNIAACVPPTPADMTEAVVSQCKVLLVDHFVIPAGLAGAKIARKLGVPVVADLDWADAPQVAEMVEATDHLIVSAAFAAKFTGKSDPAASAEALHNGRAATVVTSGGDGCHYVIGAEQKARFLPAFKVQAVETTGCGDVFHGAYAWALAAGQTPEQCVKTAAAAAAVYASRPSGWKYLATKEDLKTLVK